MGLTLLNPAQTYSVSNNFEARIPARQAQQRVIPMSQVLLNKSCGNRSMVFTVNPMSQVSPFHPQTQLPGTWE